MEAQIDPKLQKAIFMSLKHNDDRVDIIVNCPHCDRPWKKDDRCNYVICGEVAKGVLIKDSCGRDFCFRCGKKLCKTYDMLQEGKYRKHHKFCCRNVAKRNGEDYLKVYCQCKPEQTGNHVNRDFVPKRRGGWT